MNIIFLDVDGVLNNRLAIKRAAAQGTCIGALDRECIARLHKLMELTWPRTPKIVLSSSWRFSKDLVKILERKLQEFGIQIDSQTDRDGPTRGHEIQRWLASRPQLENARIVILDDDSDMLPEQMPFFVQTSMETGLTDEHVKVAAKIFEIPVASPRD